MERNESSVAQGNVSLVASEGIVVLEGADHCQALPLGKAACPDLLLGGMRVSGLYVIDSDPSRPI